MEFRDANRPPPGVVSPLPQEQSPGWALGLRQLYRVVAEEPVPSDFTDLLARLESRARGRA